MRDVGQHARRARPNSADPHATLGTIGTLRGKFGRTRPDVVETGRDHANTTRAQLQSGQARRWPDVSHNWPGFEPGSVSPHVCLIARQQYFLASCPKSHASGSPTQHPHKATGLSARLTPAFQRLGHGRCQPTPSEYPSGTPNRAKDDVLAQHPQPHHARAKRMPNTNTPATLPGPRGKLVPPGVHGRLQPAPAEQGITEDTAGVRAGACPPRSNHPTPNARPNEPTTIDHDNSRRKAVHGTAE